MSDVHADTVTALLSARLAASPEAIACSIQRGDNWIEVTWAAVGQRTAAARAQLARLGVKPGTAVAIMAPNHLDWDVVHWAALQLGARVVGLDMVDRPENLGAVLAQTSPVLLAVPTTELLLRIGAIPTSMQVVTLAEESPRRTDGGVVEPLARALGASPAVPVFAVEPTHIATTVFTSGTTGTPKGISYTHRQLCLAVQSILEALPETMPGDRVPCWLPQANLFQRIINLCGVMRGAHVFYVEKPLELAALLPGIAPHLLIGVPRFFEKAWASITETVARKPAPVRALARWAMKVGRRATSLRRQGLTPNPALRLQFALADRLVLTSMRRGFGGQLRYLVSGAAPLPVWLLEAFHGAGLLVLEAYGLSENVVPVSMNTVSAFRFGTVGRPLAATQVRVGHDGEVQVKGEGVFVGYEGSTDKAVDADGWLATGDLGSIDGDGFLTLVGRRSEVVKTSTGRKVALPAIEAVLRRLPWVELPVVVALGRTVPLAVLYVSAARLGGGEPESCLRAALEKIRADVQAVCADLASHQRPGGLVLIARPPNLESGELTGNLKVRRSTIESRYGEALEALSARLDAQTRAPEWLDNLQALVATA